VTFSLTEPDEFCFDGNGIAIVGTQPEGVNVRATVNENFEEQTGPNSYLIKGTIKIGASTSPCPVEIT
jgi:hypothetical protein